MTWTKIYWSVWTTFLFQNKVANLVMVRGGLLTCVDEMKSIWLFRATDGGVETLIHIWGTVNTIIYYKDIYYSCLFDCVYILLYIILKWVWSISTLIKKCHEVTFVKSDIKIQLNSIQLYFYIRWVKDLHKCNTLVNIFNNNEKSFDDGINELTKFLA